MEGGANCAGDNNSSYIRRKYPSCVEESGRKTEESSGGCYCAGENLLVPAMV